MDVACPMSLLCLMLWGRLLFLACGLVWPVMHFRSYKGAITDIFTSGNFVKDAWSYIYEV